MAFRNVFVLAAASVLSMAAFTTAATTTTTTATVAASALPSLVASLPACGTKCLSTVGVQIGCATTDLKCMCSQDEVFKAHFGTCSREQCDDKDFNEGLNTRDEICAAMSKNPDSATVASASSVIAANTPKQTGKGSAAGRLTHPGVLGAVVVGAGALML